jgi:hypothetical protein
MIDGKVIGGDHGKCAVQSPAKSETIITPSELTPSITPETVSCTLVRSILWRKLDIIEILKRYGTATGSYRNLAQPEQAYLPGLG